VRAAQLIQQQVEEEGVHGVQKIRDTTSRINAAIRTLYEDEEDEDGEPIVQEAKPPTPPPVPEPEPNKPRSPIKRMMSKYVPAKISFHSESSSDDDWQSEAEEYDEKEWNMQRSKDEVTFLLDNLGTDRRAQLMAGLQSWLQDKAANVEKETSDLQAKETECDSVSQTLNTAKTALEAEIEQKEIKSMKMLNHFYFVLNGLAEKEKAANLARVGRIEHEDAPVKRVKTRRKTKNVTDTGGEDQAQARLAAQQKEIRHQMQLDRDDKPKASDLLQVIARQTDEIAALQAQVDVEEAKVTTFREAAFAVQQKLDVTDPGIMEVIGRIRGTLRAKKVAILKEQRLSQGMDLSKAPEEEEVRDVEAECRELRRKLEELEAATEDAKVERHRVRTESVLSSENDHKEGEMSEADMKKYIIEQMMSKKDGSQAVLEEAKRYEELIKIAESSLAQMEGIKETFLVKREQAQAHLNANDTLAPVVAQHFAPEVPTQPEAAVADEEDEEEETEEEEEEQASSAAVSPAPTPKAPVVAPAPVEEEEEEEEEQREAVVPAVAKAEDPRVVKMRQDCEEQQSKTDAAKQALMDLKAKKQAQEEQNDAHHKAIQEGKARAEEAAAHLRELEATLTLGEALVKRPQVEQENEDLVGELVAMRDRLQSSHRGSASGADSQEDEPAAPNPPDDAAQDTPVVADPSGPAAKAVADSVDSAGAGAAPAAPPETPPADAAPGRPSVTIVTDDDAAVAAPAEGTPATGPPAEGAEEATTPAPRHKVEMRTPTSEKLETPSKQTKQEKEEQARTGELLHLQNQNVELMRAIEELQRKIQLVKESRTRGVEVSAAMLEQAGPAKPEVPQEILDLKKEVRKRQREINALRKRWWTERQDIKHGVVKKSVVDEIVGKEGRGSVRRPTEQFAAVRQSIVLGV